MKGEQNQQCNITSCNNTNANYYNHSTRKYYCKSCAMKLNSDTYNARDAQRLFGHALCTLAAQKESYTINELQEPYRQTAIDNHSEWLNNIATSDKDKENAYNEEFIINDLANCTFNEWGEEIE